LPETAARTSAVIKDEKALEEILDALQGAVDGEFSRKLRARRTDVVGDLQELRPVPPAEDVKWPNPDRPNRAETLDASLDALAAMTVEAARRPDPDAALTARIGRAARRLRGQ